MSLLLKLEIYVDSFNSCRFPLNDSFRKMSNSNAAFMALLMPKKSNHDLFSWYIRSLLKYCMIKFIHLKRENVAGKVESPGVFIRNTK